MAADRSAPSPRGLMRRLVRSFLNGLLLLGPVALTGYICFTLVRVIDGWLPFDYPGLGFVVTIAAVTLFGFVAGGVITRTIWQSVDAALGRLPFVRLVYGSVRDILNAFVGEKRSFDKPVLVAVDDTAAVQLVGFLTRPSLEALGLPDHCAVYVPQGYNFAGQVLVVPRHRVTALAVPSSEAMAFAVSGGVTGPGAAAEAPPA